MNNSEKIIATIEGLESEPIHPETALLLSLAKEAQRTGRMPDLSKIANAERSDASSLP